MSDESFEGLLAQCLLRIEAEGIEALESVCGEHPEHAARLRERVHLLRGANLIGDDDDKRERMTELAAPTADAADGVDRIGPYKILRVLGEGGMGTVYLAEQKLPVRRRVAVKVIKLGMDSKQVLARFELERQALAVMNHPTIAKIFDAGTTDLGQPYFAMEFVEGMPFTDYCRKHKLTLEERLRLFCEICQGVQHAHQKGILHRDLKPGNVLVSRKDEQHAVKLIDFGLARATNQQLIEHTIFTADGVLIGTPEYMSPEQAGGDALDIDTRTDVYSLGVILYELLTGTLPFDSESLRRAGIGEIMRVIMEDDPPKPSTKITKGGESGSEHVKRMRLQPKAYRRLIHGELDWIVMRALAKEPERRYESALSLAKDVLRHLAGEPVEAGPPTARYRISKFVRKYRVQAGAAALVVLSLVAGIIAFAIENDRANENARVAHEKASEANRERKNAEDKAKEAEKARQRADSESAKKEEANERLRSALQRSEGLRLLGSAAQTRDNDPALSLLLAIEGARMHPGLDANNALIAALEACREIRFLRHGRDLLGHVDTNFGGDRVFSVASFDATGRIFDVRTGESTLLEHPVVDGQFSPDGSRVVTRAGRTARIWDSATGQMLRALRGHDGEVTAVEMSPDGNRVATASADGTTRLWDTLTGAVSVVLKGHEGGVTTLAFDRTGDRLLTGSADKTARLWDVVSGELLLSLIVAGERPEASARVSFVVISPDGGSAVTTDEMGIARVWDFDNGEMRCAFPFAQRVDRSVAIEFNRDGSRLLTGGAKPCVRDASNGKPLMEFPAHPWRARARFTPDGNHVLTHSIDKPNIVLWDVRTGAMAERFIGHEIGAVEVCFSADGSRAVSCGWSGSVRVWDLGTPRVRLIDMVHDRGGKPIFSVSGDGNRLLVGLGSPLSRKDWKSGVWDVSGVRLVRSLDEHRLLFGALLGEGRQALLASTLGLRRMDLATGRIETVLSPQQLATSGWARQSYATTSRDGRYAATATGGSPFGDKRSMIFDLRDGRLVRVIDGHEDDVVHVAFNPDGSRIVTSSADRTARIWDVRTGEAIQEFRGHAGVVMSAAFDRRGERVITTSEDNKARVWDVSTGEQIQILLHRESVLHGAFSPDGRRVVTMARDKTVRVSDVATGTTIIEVELADPFLLDAWFLDNGRTIAALSSDGTSRMTLHKWSADPLAAAESRAPRFLTSRERRRFEMHGDERSVEPILDDLFAKHLIVEEVVDQIRTAYPDPDQRDLAIRLARQRGNPSPRDLSRDAWEVVREAGRGKVKYREALARAHAAVRLTPNEAQNLSVLGAALYRNDNFTAALETLEKREAIGKIDGVRVSPGATTVLAMTYHRLGRSKAAEAALVQARRQWEQIRDPAVDEEPLLREASTLIEPGK